MSFELGRGLDSLISNLPESVNNETSITTIKIEFIKPNKYQPRKVFDQERLQELADSIKENGIIQPIIVTKEADEEIYELVAGERRLEASKLAGFSEVPVLIRALSSKDKLLLAIIENVQREDLNALEEAKAYDQLIDEFNMSQAEVAKMMGKDRTTITNTLRLLKLDADVQQMLLNRDITQGHCRAVLQIPLEQQIKFAQKIADEQLSVRKAEVLAKSWGQTKEVTKKTLRRKDIEEKLTQTYNYKVKVEDKDGKGRVVFHYKNNDELETLIDMLNNNKKITLD